MNDMHRDLVHHTSRIVSLGVPIVVLGLGLALTAATARAQPSRPDPEIDLSTPRRTYALFQEAMRDDDAVRASHTLDLRRIKRASSQREAARLARKLHVVLDQTVRTDLDAISDEPRGDPSDGPRTDVIGWGVVRGKDVPIELVRAPLGDGTVGWLFSRHTIERIPDLYDVYGPAWLTQKLPEFFFYIRFLQLELWQWIGLVLACVIGYALGFLLSALVLRVFSRFATRTHPKWDDELVHVLRGPTRFFVTLFITYLAIQKLRLSRDAYEDVTRFWQILLVLCLAWFAIRLIDISARTLEKRLGAHLDDPKARGARTQILVMRRVAMIMTVFLALVLALLQFEVVRTVGMSLLASAGVAAVVLGFAAQKTIATLIAGIQISVSQPVRLGDAVVIEGEWGHVDEITLTYVVVKLWDERRLIVPILKFLEGSFQNWTKASPAIHGTVFLYVDYATPVPLVRGEFERYVKQHSLWDGRTATLVVTNATDRTIELRALMSAADSSIAWELRCAVREHLIGYLQSLDGGRYLPRNRVESGPLYPTSGSEKAVFQQGSAAPEPDEERNERPDFIQAG